MSCRIYMQIMNFCWSLSSALYFVQCFVWSFSLSLSLSNKSISPHSQDSGHTHIPRSNTMMEGSSSARTASKLQFYLKMTRDPGPRFSSFREHNTHSGLWETCSEANLQTNGQVWVTTGPRHGHGIPRVDSNTWHVTVWQMRDEALKWWCWCWCWCWVVQSDSDWDGTVMGSSGLLGAESLRRLVVNVHCYRGCYDGISKSAVWTVEKLFCIDDKRLLERVVVNIMNDCLK